jgi:hypothetical protein
MRVGLKDVLPVFRWEIVSLQYRDFLLFILSGDLSSILRTALHTYLSLSSQIHLFFLTTGLSLNKADIPLLAIKQI